MKPLIFVLTIQFFLTTKVFSQEKDRKIMLSYHRGTCRPTGDFRSTDFDEKKAAYAEAGIIQDFSFSYKLKPKFGLIALLRGQANSIDVDNYAQDLANYFGRSTPSGTTSVSVETSAYTAAGIMLGAFGSLPIIDKLSFEPRFLLGVYYASLPEMITQSFQSGTLLTTFTQSRAITSTIAYNIGLGAKLDVTDRIGLLLNFDYCSANAYWNDVQVIGIGHITNTYSVKNYDYAYTFSTFNVMGGIGFKF